MFQAPKAYDTIKVSSTELRSVYKAAKDAFDAFWPQFWEWAKLRDERHKAKREAEYQKELADYQRDVADARQRQDRLEREYKDAVAVWEGKCWLFRGPRPERGSIFEPALYRLRPMPPFDSSTFYERCFAEEMREYVNTMYQHAHSGSHEFELTQDQFTRMLAWKEGRVIESIKKRMTEEI